MAFNAVPCWCGVYGYHFSLEKRHFVSLANITITDKSASVCFHPVKQLHLHRECAKIYGQLTLVGDKPQVTVNVSLDNAP